MNKELQDLAWSVLPKEFKEEVKYEYHRVATKASKEEYDLGFMHAHEGMFGIHNLTSDAEGEEMLMVPRKEVQERYAANERLKEAFPKSDIYLASNAINVILQDLFGSKCLPDETVTDCHQLQEPKPTEPKFKPNDKVIFENVVCTIMQVCYADYTYSLMKDKTGAFVAWIAESDLEPYAESKFEVGDYVWYRGEVRKVAATTENNRYFLTGITESVSASDLEHYQQPFSRVKETKASVETGNNLFGQQFDGTSIAAHSKTDDHIADTGKMVRLNIAAMVLQGFVSNPDWSNFKGKNNAELRQKMAKGALDFADALLTEAESSRESLSAAKKGDVK